MLWLQNSHPTPIPAGAIGLNPMGEERVVALAEPIGPFASRAVDVAELLPDLAWPRQIELRAGKHVVRPRYEVLAGGRRRIAHVNVERDDLLPDPELPDLGALLGKGFAEPRSGSSRIGTQIGALDIDVRDAAPLAGENLVARPDDMLAGAQFDLPRPEKIRQQLGDIDRAAGERPERLGQRDDALLAHRVEPDRAGRDRRRMAVLHPQDHALAGCRRRQPGIAIGRPGIRVVRAGQRAVRLASGIAEHVERIFDDSCPAAPTMCRKSWPAKSPVANRRRTSRLSIAIAAPASPQSSHHSAMIFPASSNSVSQQLTLRAVAGPVIRGDEARVQCRGVAEEGEIGREIQRVEIDAAIGQTLCRQAHRIEAQDPRRFRQRRRKLPDQPLGVERGDKDRARAARPAIRLSGARDDRAFGADPGDILHVDRFDLRPAEAENLAEPGRRAVRIDNRDRAARFQDAISARAGAAACGCVSALYSVLPPRTLSKVSMRKAIPGHYTATRRHAAPGPLCRLEAARSGQPQHGSGIAPDPSGSFRRNRTKPSATVRVTSTATNPPATTSLR